MREPRSRRAGGRRAVPVRGAVPVQGTLPVRWAIPLAVVLPPLELPPERIREITREVLSRPEYADLRRNALERWLDDLRLSAAELLASLLGSASGSVVAWVVTGVGALVLLAVAAAVLRRLRSEPTAPGESPAPQGRGAADWAREADLHERAGRRRDAVRARFRVLTAMLVEQGVLEDIPGTTVGEYRAAVRRSAPRVADRFDAAADVFEGVWYAHEPADDEAIRRLRDAAGSLEPAGRP